MRVTEVVGLFALLSGWFFSYALARRFTRSAILAGAATLTFGTLITAWIFWVLLAFPLLPFIPVLTLVALAQCSIGFVLIKKRVPAHTLSTSTVIAVVVVTLFATWLFFDSVALQGGKLLIGSWSLSDFGAHIALIRSFSVGHNFPPEFPLFAGEPIRYHYLFDLLSGGLERAGLRLDFAINLPSIAGFTGIFLAMAGLTNHLFKKHALPIALVAFTLFTFNSSLAFVDFFREHQAFNFESWRSLFSLTEFVGFAPYKDGLVTAFWSQNILTNQRHLVLALGVFLTTLALGFELGERKSRSGLLLLGALAGLSYLLHAQIFIGAMLVMGVLAVTHYRFFFFVLAPAALVSFPQFLSLNGPSSTAGITWHLGYLAEDKSALGLFKFWIANLGLTLCAPLTLLVPQIRRWWPLMIGAFLLLLIPNLVQLSPEIAGSHKLLNQGVLVINLFTATALVLLWNKNIYLKTVAIIFSIMLMFSGIMDLMVLKNDGRLAVARVNDPVVDWVKAYTNEQDVFLTSWDSYHPVTLAGRKIYLGWPYFSWSLGYNTTTRQSAIDKIAEAQKPQLCTFLTKSKIDYVVGEKGIDNFLLDSPALKEVTARSSVSDGDKVYTFYRTIDICSNQI